MTSPPFHFFIPYFFYYSFSFFIQLHCLVHTFYPSPLLFHHPSELVTSLPKKKIKNRTTFTVKVEQYPRGLDDRLFSASCYYFWCTSRGKSWMELTIRLSESINQWHRNYIRSPVWAEGAAMLVLQLTEWGSCNKQVAPLNLFSCFEMCSSPVKDFLSSASRSFVMVIV